MGERFTLAVQTGQIELPAEGRIAVFSPNSLSDVAALDPARCLILHSLKLAWDMFQGAGFQCALQPEGAFAASIVFLPRAKALAQARIAQAVALGGVTFVDGQKTDGVDSLLKPCKQRSLVTGSYSKAHGKLFWFSGGEYADWVAPDALQIEEGFVTAPGVFSADGIDPASRALAAALPDKLGKQVADLGAGWGYLSRAILTRPEVESLYLVEADRSALECAEKNIQDARAEFHWADATSWDPRARMNSVVMNPPFHTGRAAEPELGRSFIQAAARMLAPSGQLWMVANRHLPYEASLESCFAQVAEVAGDNRFKILRADRPARARR